MESTVSVGAVGTITINGMVTVGTRGAVNARYATAMPVSEWLLCRDGKWRPVKPGTFPLASGLPARVGRLRGYGNAIVPQVAAEVILAYEVR